MRRLAYLMATAFATAGQLRAAGKTQWIDLEARFQCKTANVPPDIDHGISGAQSR